MGFHNCSEVESACNAADTGKAGLIPGSIRSPMGGNGNPLQYSFLENPMDRGAWWAPPSLPDGYRLQRVAHD